MAGSRTRTPEERTWGGLASRTVVRMARSPWATLGWVSVALVAIAMPAHLIGWWDPLEPGHLVVRVLLLGAGLGAYVGAALLLAALPRRDVRTYQQAVASCGIVVVLPLLGAACWLAGRFDVFFSPATVFGWITPPLAASSVLLIGFHALSCAGRPPVFRLRDWMILVGLWGPAVVLIAWMDNSVEWFAALRQLVVVLVAPLLTHASRRTLWLVVPFGMALAFGIDAVCDFLPSDESQQWRQYEGTMTIWITPPSWVGFLLGAWPFVFLARRAHRMSVLPPWE